MEHASGWFTVETVRKEVHRQTQKRHCPHRERWAVAKHGTEAPASNSTPCWPMRSANQGVMRHSVRGRGNFPQGDVGKQNLATGSVSGGSVTECPPPEQPEHGQAPRVASESPDGSHVKLDCELATEHQQKTRLCRQGRTRLQRSSKARVSAPKAGSQTGGPDLPPPSFNVLSRFSGVYGRWNWRYSLGSANRLCMNGSKQERFRLTAIVE